MNSIDKTSEFYLFSNKNGKVGFGIRNETEEWSCPVVGFVILKCTTEQLIQLSDKEDVRHLQEVEETYAPMIVKLKDLNEVGIDIGEWSFGFLGDVTPDEDKELLIIPTDSTHLLWMHWNVE